MTDTESTKPVQEEEHAGLSRRGFLGSSAVTGAVLAGATTLGGAVFSRES